MYREIFEAQLAAILQDAGAESVADLTDTLLAYWDGTKVVYAQTDSSGSYEVVFDLTPAEWSKWQDWLADWLTDPVISRRASR
jgi:hypothetical protein